MPREGVRIRGAVFESAVDVRDAVLARPLEISDSRFAGEVVLNRLRTPTSVSFVGSEFENTIWLDSVRIGGNLGMHDAQLARVVLKTAVIDGDLNLSQSRVAGELKAKRDHRVLLSARALEILHEARDLSEDSHLVFPSPHGRALGDNTIFKLLRDLGIGAVPHGFRSPFRDWAAECTDAPP